MLNNISVVCYACVDKVTRLRARGPPRRLRQERSTVIFFDVLHASGLRSVRLRSRNAALGDFRSSAETHYGHAASFQALWRLRTTLADRSRASSMRCTLRAADADAGRLRVACTTCIMPVSQFFFFFFFFGLLSLSHLTNPALKPHPPGHHQNYPSPSSA